MATAATRRRSAQRGDLRQLTLPFEIGGSPSPARAFVFEPARDVEVAPSVHEPGVVHAVAREIAFAVAVLALIVFALSVVG